MAGQGFDPDFILSLPTGRMGVMEGESAVMALFSGQIVTLILSESDIALLVEWMLSNAQAVGAAGCRPSSRTVASRISTLRIFPVTVIGNSSVRWT
mgnify:CR=1 FL=1